MIIEMVAAQIGEDAGAETQLIDAPFRESDGRDFRRRGVYPSLLHSHERSLKVERLRCGKSTINFAPVKETANRADDAARTASRLENRGQQIAGGGLAAGAGD